MFNSCEFIFNGMSSSEYGLMLYEIDGEGQENVSFGNIASIVEGRTTGRIQPLHYGVNYHEEPLTFDIVFGSLEPLDRIAMQDIALWLTGYQDYQWLSICQDDMEMYQFRCLITELQPISVGWVPYAFKATVTCDCPYAYGYPFEQTYAISGSTSIVFHNDSTTREAIKPTVKFTATMGDTTLSITNADDGNREFSLSGIPASTEITVDNNNGIIQDENGTLNLYGGFNYRFFRLVQGDNNLTVTGDGTLTISGRMLYNVGA